jgi:hypothetical protein
MDCTTSVAPPNATPPPSPAPPLLLLRLPLRLPPRLPLAPGAPRGCCHGAYATGLLPRGHCLWGWLWLWRRVAEQTSYRRVGRVANSLPVFCDVEWRHALHITLGAARVDGWGSSDHKVEGHTLVRPVRRRQADPPHGDFAGERLGGDGAIPRFPQSAGVIVPLVHGSTRSLLILWTVQKMYIR